MYGIVTLAHGMLVALTDHIDRSPGKQLLRGKIGKVHSWVVHEDETSKFEDGVRVLRKLPKVVMVKFHEADGSKVEWRLPGTTENGLYPIVKKRYLVFGKRQAKSSVAHSQITAAIGPVICGHIARGARPDDET